MKLFPKSYAFVLLPLALACSLAFYRPARAQQDSAESPHVRKGPPPLHVDGNALKTPDGATVRLQGVNVPGLEWSNVGDGPLLKSVLTALQDWHANAIRLPLSQDRWFGKMPGQTDDGMGYRHIVDQVVDTISEHNAYVILDLHWSDAGLWGKYNAQHKMPDANSQTFWTAVAEHYANRPAVLFDLYNEPHDVSWDIWKDGGTVSDTVEDGKKALTYQTPGMQALLKTVRDTGARNVVIAGGLDWAYDLSGLANGHALTEPSGNGILYATHIYPWKTDWDTHVGRFADRYAIFVGEVGCQPDAKQEEPKVWAPKILAYIRKNRLNWTAWCFHPSASPRLLENWDYRPTPYWGVFVKDALTDEAKF